MNLTTNNNFFNNLIKINGLFLTSLFIGLLGILITSSTSITSIILSILFFSVNILLFMLFNSYLLKNKDVIEEYEDIKTVSDLSDLDNSDESFDLASINEEMLKNEKTTIDEENARHLDSIADKMIEDFKQTGLLVFTTTMPPTNSENNVSFSGNGFNKESSIDIYN